MQGLKYSFRDVEACQGRDFNTAIPKKTTPLTRLQWSTAHFDDKKNL